MKQQRFAAFVALATCITLLGLGLIGDRPAQAIGSVVLWGGVVIHGLAFVAFWSEVLWMRLGRPLVVVGLLHLAAFSVAVFPSALIAFAIMVAVTYAWVLREGSGHRVLSHGA